MSEMRLSTTLGTSADELHVMCFVETVLVTAGDALFVSSKVAFTPKPNFMFVLTINSFLAELISFSLFLFKNSVRSLSSLCKWDTLSSTTDIAFSKV